MQNTLQDATKTSSFRAVALTIVLSLFAFSSSAHAQARDITGTWQGTLQTGTADGLRTLVRVYKDDGKMKAVMYSVDQGGGPIPITAITVEGSTVTFNVKARDLTYTGTLGPEGKTISGNVTEAGQTHVLNLNLVQD